MARLFLIIDGYNLMHAIGLSRQNYGPGDLEVHRNRLLRQLAVRLDPATIVRTTIVFDAFAANSDSNRFQNTHGLSVVYAPSGTDADSEIERRIASHPAPRQLVVVSSDQRLHRSARRRRAHAVNSTDFWTALDPEDDLAEQGTPERPSRGKQEVTIMPPEIPDIDVPGDAEATDPLFNADYLSDLEDELDQL